MREDAQALHESILRDFRSLLAMPEAPKAVPKLIGAILEAVPSLIPELAAVIRQEHAKVEANDTTDRVALVDETREHIVGAMTELGHVKDAAGAASKLCDALYSLDGLKVEIMGGAS